MRLLSFLFTACAALSGAQGPGVGLNHFYLAVDPATYSAIAGSAFLRTEFAAFERRTTVRTDSTYTGTYFYGRRTYFEFFEAGKASGQELGNSGVAFGTDSAGAASALQRGSGGKYATETITRGLNGSQIPWFEQLGPGDSRFVPLRTWLMEYRPEFLEQWHSEASGERGIQRESVLDRYRAALNLPRSGRRWLEDVTGLTIAVSPADREKLEQFAAFLGFTRKADGDSVVLEGNEIQLRLRSNSALAPGIREVRFRTNGRPKQHEHRFGPRSKLRFPGENIAVWTF